MEIAAHLLSSIPTATLCGLEEDLCDWILHIAPHAHYSLIRKPETSLAIYGDNYHAWLPQDYEANAAANIRTVLCLSHECASGYLDLLRLHVRHIIYPGIPYDLEAIRLAITPPPIAELDSGLPFSTFDPAIPLLVQETQRVKSAGDIHDALTRTTAFFEAHGHTPAQASAAGLVVKEGITNCIFHAFRQAGSHERKYDPDQFTALEDEDIVNLTLGKTEREIIVRIDDNSGGLAPLRIGNSLDRQTTEKGLFDNRGRGFYLMRHISDRAVCLVRRGVSTAIELYFLHPPQSTKEQPETQQQETQRPPLKHFELLEL